jgi:hypothetical protein
MKNICVISRAVALLLPVTLFAAACGSSTKIPLYPAEGKVLFNDKPAPGAIVWLHPMGPVDASIPKPHGKCGTDGTFRLGTFTTDDGAPAGKYHVTVFWTEPTKSGDMDGKNLLPTRYQDSQKSGLPLVEIKAGRNELRPFLLKR